MIRKITGEPTACQGKFKFLKRLIFCWKRLEFVLDTFYFRRYVFRNFSRIGKMNDSTVNAIVSGIADKILRCRKEAGLTLNQLSQAADVSPAAIHKIEKREMIPSITVLMKIARALNRGIGFFTQEDNGNFHFQEQVEVARRDHRRVLTSPSGSRMEVLAMCLEGGRMEACIFTFGPGSRSGLRVDSHKGEELFLVMEGEMSFVLGEEICILREGDSLHFNSETPHRWENSGEAGLKFLWAMTPLPVSSLERWIP
jgi:transcriptional regulator with XRE-family HTH domain